MPHASMQRIPKLGLLQLQCSTDGAGADDQELMLGWGGCRVRPGICSPGAGQDRGARGDPGAGSPTGHQESFEEGSTHTSKAATKAVGLIALGFAFPVARSSQHVCLFLHLAPLIRGTHSLVLPKEQAAANKE